MRRTALFALTIALLLGGCASRRQEKDFERWRAAVQSAAAVTLTAEITAQTEDAAFTCQAEGRLSPEETRLTLTAPASIAGVSCRRSAGKDTLEYDGLILELCLEGETLSPCQALPLLAEALYRGSVESVGAGRAEMLCPDGEHLTLFRGEDGLPAAAELRRSERTELIIRITHWGVEE